MSVRVIYILMYLFTSKSDKFFSKYINTLTHSAVWLITRPCCMDHCQFVEEVGICKDILLPKQVNPVAWLCVTYFYDHVDINPHANFFSKVLVCCLHDENTYRPCGCDTGVT